MQQPMDKKNRGIISTAIKIVIVILLIAVIILIIWYFHPHRVGSEILSSAEYEKVAKQLPESPICSSNSTCKFYRWIGDCASDDQSTDVLDEQLAAKVQREALAKNINVDPAVLLGECTCYKNRCVVVHGQ